MNKTFFHSAAALAGTFAFMACTACVLPPSPPYHGEDAGTSVGIHYASFYWKKEDDFKRISEFFTDNENTGSNVVVRSDEGKRDGLYLMLNLEHGKTVPAGSVAELHYFHPKKSGVQVCTWTLPEFNPAPHRELRLGLTGNNWDKSLSGKRPSAWKLTITAPDGTLLVRRTSYLWSESR